MKYIFALILLANLCVLLWEYRSGAFAPRQETSLQALIQGVEPILLASEVKAEPQPILPENNPQTQPSQPGQNPETQPEIPQVSGGSQTLANENVELSPNAKIKWVALP